MRAKHSLSFYLCLLQELLLMICLIDAFEGLNPCPKPNFSKGKIRYKHRGRLAKFQCQMGYELLGQRYAICTAHKTWDGPAPVCMKAGCKGPDVVENGMQYIMRDGAVVMFFCSPGYQLKGSATAYCDGVKWNATAPKCLLESTEPALSCDFEQDDLCGWTHDPLHDFDWRRQNMSTPSGHIGTGPSYDHTKGEGKNGYYMYIESTSRKENDSARFLSPLYPASLTNDGCFVFYYHMYGRTTGTLRVLVHPQSVTFTEINADADLAAKYTMFLMSGNQGNAWYRGFFDIDVLQEDFQIVIEGIRGPGYVSDIAVDDLALLQGAECIAQKEDILSSTTPITVEDSCLNRCWQPTSANTMDCQCNDDCFDQSTCCVDYRDFCVFSASTDDPSGNTDDSVQDSDATSTLPPHLPTSLKMIASNGTYNNANQDISSTTEKIAPTQSTTVRTTPTSQTTTKTTKTTSVTTIKTTLAKITSSSTTSTTKTAIKKFQLQFATAPPPLRNATRANKTNENDSSRVGFKPPQAFVPVNVDKNITSPNIKIKNATTSVVGKFVTLPSVEVVSKTFAHYEKLKTVVKSTAKSSDGTDKTVEAVAATKVSNKLLNMKYKKNEEPRTSAVAYLVAGMGLIFAAGLVLLSVKHRSTLTAWARAQVAKHRSSQAEQVRFLVQAEELEHDYEE